MPPPAPATRELSFLPLSVRKAGNASMPASPPASCGRSPGSVAFPGQQLGTVNQHFPVRGWHYATTMVPPPGTGNVPPTPQGRPGQWLAPGTSGTLKLVPWLIPHSHSMLPEAHFQCTETHQNPPKHPKILPHRHHSDPGMSPFLHFTKTLGFGIFPMSTSSHAPVGKGQEPGGIPPSPPTISCLPGSGPGPGADGPSRHGRTAQHGALGHGKARHGSSGCDALLQPGLPSHTPTRQENLGFPRATCWPCQDCPMSPKPVTRTRADTPQTFLAINRPPLRTAPAEPRSLLRSCPPPHPKITRQCPQTTRQL